MIARRVTHCRTGASNIDDVENLERGVAVFAANERMGTRPAPSLCSSCQE